MIEQRFFKTGHELRAEGQGDEMAISGYAATWHTLSANLGGFRERIVPGAFTRSLQSDRDVMCNVNHNPDLILGRKKNKTLSVSEDGHGLRFRCLLPDTSTGRDIHALVTRGDISDCSFAFEVDGKDGEQWSDVDDPDNPGSRMALRSLVNVKLHDTAVVGSPAYSGTSVKADRIIELNNKLEVTEARGINDYWPAGLPESFSIERRSEILRSYLQQANAKAARERLVSMILS